MDQPPARDDQLVHYATRSGRWVIAATVLGSGMASIDATVVGTAVPSIGRNLQTSIGALQWVVSGYTLTLAALLLPAGVLGDQFGRRRIFNLGVVWFAVASALCAVAPDAAVLIVMRFLQGVGAALLTPGSLAIIEASFDDKSRSQAIGAWSGLGGVATAAGPLLTRYGWCNPGLRIRCAMRQLVIDDTAAEMFAISMDGVTAKLEYDVDDGRLLLLHTEVPEVFSGQGVGARLVEAALAKARKDKLTIVPWCPFARRWLKEHPEQIGDVTVDFKTPPPENSRSRAWLTSAPISTVSMKCRRRRPVARTASVVATAGSTCVCACTAVTSAAATARPTATPPPTGAPNRTTLSSGLSNRVRIGGGATPTNCSSNWAGPRQRHPTPDPLRAIRLWSYSLESTHHRS